MARVITASPRNCLRAPVLRRHWRYSQKQPHLLWVLQAGAGIGDLFHRRHDVIVAFFDKPEVNFLVDY